MSLLEFGRSKNPLENPLKIEFNQACIEYGEAVFKTRKLEFLENDPSYLIIHPLFSYFETLMKCTQKNTTS